MVKGTAPREGAVLFVWPERTAEMQKRFPLISLLAGAAAVFFAGCHGGEVPRMSTVNSMLAGHAFLASPLAHRTVTIVDEESGETVGETETDADGAWSIDL